MALMIRDERSFPCVISLPSVYTSLTDLRLTDA